MFSRHLIAAAALLATTFSAQAEVIPVSNAASLTANMNIVDGASSLNGGSLADLLAASNDTAQLYLVRGVEGLYMVASRTIAQSADVVAADATAQAVALVPTSTAGAVSADAPVVAGTTPQNADADPVVNAAEVPEPTSLALLLAGVLGAAAFTRTRKQG